MGKEVVTSLRSLYGEKWREGLLVHILIGLGRSLMERSQVTKSPQCEKLTSYSEKPDQDEGAISELQENPLAYVHMMNEKLADELETQLRTIGNVPVKHDSSGLYPDSGELMEAIGVQARLRLEGSRNDELATLLESTIQVAWEDASLGVREDMLRILRLLSFFSASVCT